MDRLIVACALLACVHALPSLLSIVATTNTTAPDIAFISVETRGKPWLMKIGHFPQPVINLASGSSWPDLGKYHLKVHILTQWLEKQPASKLVAFLEGDVFWGGCSLNQFANAYNDIVRETGAPVVFGAELACNNQDCRRAPSMPSYLENRTLAWSQFSACPATCGPKNCVVCDDPPRPRFLNPGLIMGPAGHLLKMTLVVSSRFRQWSGASNGDQGVFAEYWLQNPKEVTLDYETKLVMNLAFMAENATALNKTTGAVINNARKEPSCFVHGNGPSKPRSRKMVQDLGFAIDSIQDVHLALGQLGETLVDSDGSFSRPRVQQQEDGEQPTRRLTRRHLIGSSAAEEA